MSDEFTTWLADQPLPLINDTFSLEKIEALLRSAWSAGGLSMQHEMGNLKLLQDLVKDTPEEIAAAIGKVRSDEFQMNATRPEVLGLAFTLAEALRDSLKGCPAVSPSDKPCIGRAFWHEVHSDAIGSTWRDYAGKVPGLR